MKTTIELDSELPIREAAERYQLSERTLHRWIANGTLPAYRIGSRLVRVRVRDIEKLRTRIPAVGAS